MQDFISSVVDSNFRRARPSFAVGGDIPATLDHIAPHLVYQSYYSRIPLANLLLPTPHQPSLDQPLLISIPIIIPKLYDLQSNTSKQVFPLCLSPLHAIQQRKHIDIQHTREERGSDVGENIFEDQDLGVARFHGCYDM